MRNEKLAMSRAIPIPLIFVICYLLTAVCSLPPVHAQTAAEVESLLEQSFITCEQAAYFTLSTAMENPPQRNVSFAYAQEQGWLPAKAEETSRIRAGELSLLVMKAFDLKGGLMYRITGSKRYAFRELKHKRIITGRVYPNQLVSGEQLFQILDEITEGIINEQ